MIHHSLDPKQISIRWLFAFTGSCICLLIVLTSGCKKSDSVTSPIPTALQDSVALGFTESTFNIPITYSIKSLESFINHKLTGNFLETIIQPESKNNLEIGLSISKTSDIILKSNGKEIICIVPLSAVATVLNSSMNIITKGLKPIEAKVVLELRTRATLDAQWHLVTKFNLVKTTWIESPKLKVLGINFDLQQSVDKLLLEDETMLTALLDDEINKGVSLEKAVGQVWADLQKPIPVSKEPPHIYVKFNCESIAGKFTLSDTTITCLTSITAKVGLITDTTGLSSGSSLPPFEKNYTGDNLSEAYLHFIVGFDALNRVLDDLLIGNTFTTSGMSLNIKDVVVYGSDLGMIIKLKASGAIDGELIATATPYFDSTEQLLSFKEFDFKIVSNNALLKLANVFLHNMIRDSIQSGLSLELNSVLNGVPNVIHKAVAEGEAGKTIDINVCDLIISSCDFVVDSESIHLHVHTYFYAGIVLKQITPGEPVRIRSKNKTKPSAVGK